MDKNLLQKAKAPMIALIQKKNIVENKTKRAAALLLMLALLALLAPGAANAQNRAIVTIGEGTYGQIYPLPGYYGYQYSVYLYTPSAAPALDLDCDISSIAFNVRDNSTNTGAKMYIWVKDVDADYALAETTTFSEYTEGATQVYENDDFSSTDGWNTFAFTSDFSHEGGKALLVAVYGVGCTGDGGCGRTCYYTPTESNTQWRKRANNNDPGTNVSGEVTVMRANIQLNLTYTEAVCLSPSGLAASNITDNSATLSWNENGTATAWVLQYGTDSAFGTYTEENVSTTPSFDLTGLTALTIYYARVKPDCDTEGSLWSNTVQFYYMPPCNGPITITAYAPYTQGFEIPTGTGLYEEGPLPYCWEGYSTNTSRPAPHNVVNQPVHNGTQSMGFNTDMSSVDVYAILPEFDTDLNQLQISFWMQTLNGDLGQFQLGYITAEDDGTCNTFTAIETYGPSEDIMTQRTTYLDGLPASAHRLVFKKTEVASPCYIDDVLVMLNDGCYIVQNLRRGGKSHDHIYLSWDLTDNSQTEWDVQVATDANFTENVTNLVADSHENYLLDGLDASTHYFVRVKPTCNDNLWSNTIDFTTLCEPIEVTANAPYTEGFESPTGTHYNEAGPLPDCWEAHSIGTKPPHNCNNANYAYSGSQSLVFVAANSSEYAVLPEFSNPFSDLQISFWMRTQNNTNGQLQLGYITAEDDGTCNTFTPVATYDNSVDYVQRTIYLYNVPVTAVRLAFKWEYSHANTALCYIDDVEVEICTLDCYPLGNLSVGEVTYNSAYLSWDLIDNSQTAWDVQVATDADFTAIVAEYEADSHENYLVEGLSGNTQYYVRVRAICDDTHQSEWSNAFDFTTLCGYDITLETPYTQNFDSPEGTATNTPGPLPPCWEAYRTDVGTDPHNCTFWGHNNTQSLAFYNNDFAYAILPEFSNPINELQINFWMRADMGGALLLGYLTAEDDGTCNSFTPIVNYGDNNGNVIQQSTVLDNVPAEAERMVFRWFGRSNIFPRCFIDDVVVSINPCAKPTNLAVGNLTQETADITWEGSLGNYAVRHRTAAHYDGVCIDEPFTTNELPSGWDRYQTTSYGSFSPTQYGWIFTTYGLDAYNLRCRLYDPNTNYWLITPSFTVGENYSLSFDVALTDHDNSNPPITPCNDQTMFIVQISTDNMQSWQTLREWNNSGSEYVLNNIPHTGQNVSGISLADYEGQNVRIAFHCVRTDTNYDWVNDLHIDNVLIGDPVAVPAGEWTDPVAVTGNMHHLSDLTAGTRYEAQVRSNLGECDNWSDVLAFKTLEQNAGKFFVYEGNWNEAGNWIPAGAPTASDNVILRANATIPAGSVAFANTIAGTNEHTLTVKDGGQLFHYQNINNQNITVTLEKEIAGHDGSAAAGWYFIGSPVIGGNSVTPTAENGFLVNNYDLYYYDEPTHYWMNHKPGNSNSGFGLSYGRGYLYANDEGTTLKISGEVGKSEMYVQKYVTHQAEVLNGFNLVGNPFLHNARVNTTAYVIDNGAVVAYTEGTKIIAPGEGVMVQTTLSYIHFQRINPDAAAPQPNQLQITVNQKAEQKGAASSMTLIDNAIINFKDGGTLEKFDFGRTDAKVYIPQDGKDYAVVNATETGEIPVNFKAERNGTYTLTFGIENVDFNYLHLIDNLTGADVDLLTPPACGHLLTEGDDPLLRGQEGFNNPATYTFTAKTTDYASRFRLVFVCGDADDDNDAPFAFISNGQIIVTADVDDATLQVIDVLGRVILTRTVTPNSTLPTPYSPGVYVLRLIDGGEIKTQKIVIQ